MVIFKNEEWKIGTLFAVSLTLCICFTKKYNLQRKRRLVPVRPNYCTFCQIVSILEKKIRRLTTHYKSGTFFYCKAISSEALLIEIHVSWSSSKGAKMNATSKTGPEQENSHCLKNLGCLEFMLNTLQLWFADMKVLTIPPRYRLWCLDIYFVMYWCSL